ncbi:hypothetical protein LINPERHAP2_LOCUS42303, partial [Linum perenne]
SPHRQRYSTRLNFINTFNLLLLLHPLILLLPTQSQYPTHRLLYLSIFILHSVSTVSRDTSIPLLGFSSLGCGEQNYRSPKANLGFEFLWLIESILSFSVFWCWLAVWQVVHKSSSNLNTWSICYHH